MIVVMTQASEKKFFKAVDDHDEVHIDFESDEIILDIPQDALEIKGWMLYPTGYPMVIIYASSYRCISMITIWVITADKEKKC